MDALPSLFYSESVWDGLLALSLGWLNNCGVTQNQNRSGHGLYFVALVGNPYFSIKIDGWKKKKENVIKRFDICY